MRVQAENHAETSENRIHSDDIAQRLGFTGALVPGVAVYGYMTGAVTSERFLSESFATTRFLKPAYHGDWLDIQREGEDVSCLNEQGTLLATLNVQHTLPAEPHDATAFANAPVPKERVPITWDSIHLERPFEPWVWSVDAASNHTYSQQVSDTNPLYERFAHPHWLLGICNTVLTRQYVMPTWIHVGSEISHRAAVCVGDEITVQGVPLERWKKKGHEFVRVLIRFTRGDTLTTEVMHTAIYKVAGV